MAESQEDIDSLLAEVNALADEAVADIVGNEATDITDVASSEEIPAGSDSSPPVISQTEPKQSSEETVLVRPVIKGKPGEYIERILKLKVPVIVQLAERSMDLSTIVNMSTGAILEFEKPSDAELSLMINNKRIGQGHAVKVGENFGLRINGIGSVRERIEALGNK